MERKYCTICNDTNFDKLYELTNMPISLSVTTNDIKNDIHYTQELFYCKKCGCVQLKKLIDPNILYNTTHNLNSTFPTWSEHHKRFSDFILTNIKYKKITEIGGSSGSLYDKLKDYIKEYKCIDLCQPNFDTTNIEYVIGNCEDYEFKDTDCIAMSHIFEHLYNPRKFIENISKNNVKSVYISIPNMMSFLENLSPTVINYEHTYFVDTIFIKYLFSQFGYSLVNSEKFKEHSLFFHFEKNNCNPIDLEYRDTIKNKMLDVYNDLMNRFTKYTIPENSFIIPGGYMGQLIYLFSKPKFIHGFLDNDVSKQGKRQYGTPYFTFPFSELNNYNSDINIFLYSSHVSNELIEQLKTFKNYNNFKIYII